MTETVPETDDLVTRLRAHCNGHPHAKVLWPHRIFHEAATALEAAQARIAELEARPTIKTHDGAIAVLVSDVEIAATARREALEDAANTERECPTHVTDAYRLGWSDAMKVRTERIRALMEKPNENG